MPFSHHSHSGQFCHHAEGSLRSMVETAISRRMRTYALTEHMPRDQEEDLYPEEVAAQVSNFDLFQSFAAYYDAAQVLRGDYRLQIHLLVGFEAEYIRPSSIEIVRDLQEIYKFDFFVGSVHHVNAIPIDYDREMYERALVSCRGSSSTSGDGDGGGGVGAGGGGDNRGNNGTDEEAALFERYFDHQYEMMTRLRPAVIAHFDLPRLMARDPARPVSAYGDAVWQKALRNLQFLRSYNGLLEFSSASLRKGWDTPYPGADICSAFISLDGRFTLSDDAHSSEQVGLNYARTLEYVKSLGLTKLCYLEKLPMGEMAIDVLDACAVRTMSIEELEMEPFWTS